MPKNLLNAAHGFPEWWLAYPTGPRKAAKQQCLDKWCRLGCASDATLIREHVEWLKTQEDWQRGFVCAPLVYLNQQRWVDWTPPAKQLPKVDELAKIKNHKGAAPSPEIREQIARLRGKRT